jgi:hypothetical protein
MEQRPDGSWQLIDWDGRARRNEDAGSGKTIGVLAVNAKDFFEVASPDAGTAARSVVDSGAECAVASDPQDRSCLPAIDSQPEMDSEDDECDEDDDQECREYIVEFLLYGGQKIIDATDEDDAIRQFEEMSEEEKMDGAKIDDQIQAVYEAGE